MPLPIDDRVFLTVDSSYDTIAISPDAHKYRLPTITDLVAECFRLGNFYACSRGNNTLHAPLDTGVDKSDDPAVCLWALVRGWGDVAGKTCRKSLVNPGTAVVQISAQIFFTYGQMRGHLKCRLPKNIVMPFATQRFGTFHLPPGCSAISELFSLHSSNSAYTRPEEEWTMVSAISINTLQMLDGMDLS